MNIREAFGAGIMDAAEKNPKVVALGADLAESVGLGEFREKYPEKYVEVGIAEQNLVTIASGMAAAGMKPFAASYAAFNPGRNYEQIRTTIAINDRPVVIVGSHTGVNVGPDGATHQMTEDISMMRSLPNMAVFAPGDIFEARELAKKLADFDHPAYVRLPRETPADLLKHEFKLGEIYTFREGSDLTIFATGNMTANALAAAEMLSQKNISAEVVHVPTIKIQDEEISRKMVREIVKKLAKNDVILTVEDHQIAGGFGGMVAEILAENLGEIERIRRDNFRKKFTKEYADIFREKTNSRKDFNNLREELPRVKFSRIGINDVFGQSGTAEELYDFYGISAEKIAQKAHEMLK